MVLGTIGPSSLTVGPHVPSRLPVSLACNPQVHSRRGQWHPVGALCASASVSSLRSRLAVCSQADLYWSLPTPRRKPEGMRWSDRNVVEQLRHRVTGPVPCHAPPPSPRPHGSIHPPLSCHEHCRTPPLWPFRMTLAPPAAPSVYSPAATATCCPGTLPCTPTT
jgi:hypothetical protein